MKLKILFTTMMTTKTELALRYIPGITPHAAVNRLMAWVKGCKELMNALTATGYRNHQKYLTGKQVQLIYDYLGEPLNLITV